MPCLVKGEVEPAQLSLAENVIRVPMHPADQVVAFTKLADAGQSVSAIAVRFGASERIVEQRLRLGNATPELLDTYRARETRAQRLVRRQRLAHPDELADMRRQALDQQEPGSLPTAAHRVGEAPDKSQAVGIAEMSVQAVLEPRICSLRG